VSPFHHDNKILFEFFTDLLHIDDSQDNSTYSPASFRSVHWAAYQSISTKLSPWSSISVSLT
jgi:hypothetical protein